MNAVGLDQSACGTHVYQYFEDMKGAFESADITQNA